MTDFPLLGNLCMAWLCCLQPIFCLGAGLLIGRYGGVRSAIAHLLDRVGVPRSFKNE